MYACFGKRIFDLFVVFCALFFLWPLILLVAFCIKIFDPGPVFFRQNRVGKVGSLVSFIKFRSMPVSTEDIPSDKVGTVKLTWIGRLIRRTNLDELPQLLNIARGEMSVVGPRPPIPSQQELVEIRKRNGALARLPGLTGLAQINWFDGMSVAQKAEYDGEYSKNVSFFNDLKIILRTIVYLLKPPPVY